MKNNKGFTLLEVVIVALIISIIAMFALVDFRGQSGRVNKAKIKSDLQEIKKAMCVYGIKYRKYPQTFDELKTGLQVNSEVRIPRDPYGGTYSIRHVGDLLYIGTYSNGTEELKVGVDK
ncbi:MAG: hypothetical protein C0601_11650 [Candidatus Muiribacterium halophilum]|uniref:Type II secretion system protein GspG C-terminal domain-containing protein n=1 Tax=Muiribacterium halophilum TaxID=2053465 RepID=A0A2N5ZBJ0_MUIH1|nr:MAG: hypothetical protein C0601_11650 [Candidatus Muirbacterium halophilum]